MDKAATGTSRPDLVLSVVVPIYNEADNIGAFLQRLERALDGLDHAGGASRASDSAAKKPGCSGRFEDQMDRGYTSIGCWIMSRRGCGRHPEDATSRDLEVLRRPTSLTRRRDFLKAAYGAPLVHGYS